MITGEVKPSRDPLIRIVVGGPSGVQVELDAVVDTGFTDYLSLPSHIVRELSLSYVAPATYELGDGGKAVFNLHEGSVQWDGRWRAVFVSAAEGGPLVGMALMEGYHLGIDVIDGGRVELRPLTTG